MRSSLAGPGPRELLLNPVWESVGHPPGAGLVVEVAQLERKASEIPQPAPGIEVAQLECWGL